MNSNVASPRRLPNTTASLPIVYGSIAFYLGKKADELQTHEWTLFLRGPNKHDDHLSSHIISKVVFELHSSFANPSREIYEPPYEVTERGWGEFEAQIRIHWKDPTEQPIVLNHTIKLYPQGTPPTLSSAANNNNALMQLSTENPVLAEAYDEVVFTNPTHSFFQSLTQITAVPKNAEEDAFAEDFTNHNNDENKSEEENQKALLSPSWRNHLNAVYSDRDDFLAMIAAQKFLQDELSKVKQRFQIVNDEIIVADQKLVLVQQQKQRETAAAAVSGPADSSSSGGERKRTKKSRSTSQNKKSRGAGNTNKGSGTNTSATSINKRKSASVTAKMIAPTAAVPSKAVPAATAARTVVVTNGNDMGNAKKVGNSKSSSTTNSSSGGGIHTTVNTNTK